jgi:hypothetical protein
MTSVYLNAWASADDQSIDPSLHSIPLFRRMTPLQKAVLQSLCVLGQRWPGIVDALTLSEAPVYFTSAFGEITAMLGVTGAIQREEWPVSPKDFQHSVLNAALAYLAISQAWHQSAFALSSGYATSDCTVYLATHRIKSGLESSNLLIHGAEVAEGDTVIARAEVLIFGHNPWSQKSLVLHHQSWMKGQVLDDDPTLKIFHDPAEDGQIA